MFKYFLCLILLNSFVLFAEIPVIKSENFSEEIRSGLVLVEFYGPWCGPCKRLSPVLEDVAKQMKGKVKIVKVNIDQSKDLMKEYNVEGVPTMILFYNGKEEGRLVGFRDQETVESFIKK